MQIIANTMSERLQAASDLPRDPQQMQFRQLLAGCCLVSRISLAVFEHNMQTDSQAKHSLKRKELAIMSLPEAWTPDAKLHGDSAFFALYMSREFLGQESQNISDQHSMRILRIKLAS